MQRAQELFDLFRDPATDTELLGGVGLSKGSRVVLADLQGAISAVPYALELDGDRSVALCATHASFGRRNAALVVLSTGVSTAAAFAAAAPSWKAAAPVVVDTGRLALMSETSANLLRRVMARRRLTKAAARPASHTIGVAARAHGRRRSGRGPSQRLARAAAVAAVDDADAW